MNPIKKNDSISVLPKEGPLITGGRLRYSLGDRVDVNCTSAESKPAAEIRWFINGQPVSSTVVVFGRYPRRCNPSESCNWRE